MIRTITRALAVLALAGAASAASAGGYVGGSIGLSFTDFCGNVRQLGLTNCQDNDRGFRMFGGYDFTDYLAVEVSYLDYGKIGAWRADFRLNAEATAIVVAGKGSVSVANNVDLFAKAGMSRWDSKVSATGFADEHDGGSDRTYGVGALISFADHGLVRFEWERLDADGVDIDLLSMGVGYSF